MFRKIGFQRKNEIYETLINAWNMRKTITKHTWRAAAKLAVSKFTRITDAEFGKGSLQMNKLSRSTMDSLPSCLYRPQLSTNIRHSVASLNLSNFTSEWKAENAERHDVFSRNNPKQSKIIPTSTESH